MDYSENDVKRDRSDSQVAKQLDSLSQNTNILMELIDSLEYRLASVIRVLPESPVAGKLSSDPLDNKVALASELEDLTRKISNLGNRLISLRDRIEL